MNKLVTVLGVTAVVTLVGCKDPNYKSYRTVSQNDVKVVEPVEVPAAEPVAKKSCSCAPGTKHAEPCKCGAEDCKCAVEVKPVPAVPVEEVAPAKKAEGEYTVYIVQNGDYLAKISKKFNITIAAIKSLNGLKSDVIRVGQKLKLPGKVDVGVQTEPAKAAAKSAKAFKPYEGATKEYIVKNGDTLGAIAYGNGCNIRQLKQLNSLKSDNLKIGQKLKVPANGKAAKTVKEKKPAKAEEVEKPSSKAVEAEPKAEPAKEAAIPAAEVKEDPVKEESLDKPVSSVETSAPAAEAPATTTYVVQEGDDMTAILIRFGVSAAVVRELNNLPDDAQLKPGQVIKLPAEVQQ